LAVTSPRENDCDPSFKVVKLKGTRSLPENISLIFGDSVHNLRSALDHLAYELVTIETSKTREVVGENLLKDIMFPIAKDSKDLEKKIRSRQMQRAGEPVVKALRELRPYPKGNDGIITLNYLDICDKHRLIIPVIEATVPSLSTIIDSGGTYTIQIDADQPIEFDKELWRIRSNSFGSRGSFPPISIDVGLPIGTPFAGMRVAGWLGQMANYLDGVIASFESLCIEGKAFKPPAPISRGRGKTGLIRL
jgi:hypothetical protein